MAKQEPLNKMYKRNQYMEKIRGKHTYVDFFVDTYNGLNVNVYPSPDSELAAIHCNYAFHAGSTSNWIQASRLMVTVRQYIEEENNA